MVTAADFQRVFEASPQAQLLLGPGDTVLSVTDGYLRAAGCDRPQLVGRTLFEVAPYVGCPESLREQLRSELQKVWGSGLQFPHEFAAAALAPALSVSILDASGAVRQIVHTLGHATRVAEATESDSERRLRKLIEHSYDGILLIGTDGKPFYASPSIERVRGYSVSELTRVTLLELVHPDDLPRFGQAVKKLQGEPGGVMLLQYRARHRDGHWHTLESAAVNRLHDPDIRAIVVTSRDVSERVALQEELRRRNEELQISLAAAQALCWDVDLERKRPTSYSSSPAAFFGYAENSDEFDFTSIVHPEDLPGIMKQIARSAETGQDLIIEFRGLPRDDRKCLYASHARVARDESGRPARMVGVTWDITERRRIQDEQEQLKQRIQEGQKLESLGILAGGIAHDFNNILTTILGNASLTRLALSETSPALEHIGQIEEASRRATDLCRQMLAYAGKGRFILQRAKRRSASCGGSSRKSACS